MISSSEFSHLVHLYPMLRELPARLQSDFEQKAWQVEARPERVLFDVGNYCRLFLFIITGSIQVISYQNSRQILLFTLQPGDFCVFTAACLLANCNHLACGTVTEELSAIAIPGELFVQLVAESDEFRMSVLGFFGKGLIQLLALVQELAFQRMDQRLAAILIGKGDRIKITHQELADELGTVREVVSRILKEFERQGFIRRMRGQIRILNRPALEEIAKLEGD
jgi:CRP/FNR family transcriptional regulator